jgi:aspartyl-tRNA synthetase
MRRFSLAASPKPLSLSPGARAMRSARLGPVEKDRFAFAWIVDFPMYEKDPETGAIDFSHNPFSMPQGGLEACRAIR